MENTRLSDLFEADPHRFEKFSFKYNGLLLDYSKQRINSETLQKLIALAEAGDLKHQIQSLFAGGLVNRSEGRPALHMALRNPNSTASIQAVLDRLERWVEALREGKKQGARQMRITDIISLGIGGSDLGPSMVLEALREYHSAPIQVHFISNLDGQSLASVLAKCNPATTFCVINSKTFTTLETMHNAKRVKAWFSNAFSERDALAHFVGVTANPEQAKKFGIHPENIFEFWDFVGGRYSVWSAVGLPIALTIGMDHFRSFLAGAYAMDRHFQEAPFDRNMPVLMALLGIWNSNFWECKTQAIIPYDDGLRKFPDYLQQLEMESNGKKAHQTEGFVDHTTAPIIWGGVGCNSQHAYMQLLHQGTEVVPVDFLISVTGHSDFVEHQQLLVASCLSQSKALMEGNGLDSLGADPLAAAKHCFGNRPSNTLIYPKLTPAVLGSLIALYEHKVFVQGVLWGINSFDQWGVELGKKLVDKILPYLKTTSGNTVLDNAMDSSTAGLIQFFKENQ
jgi:glucose-6-phosphate isomerase